MEYTKVERNKYVGSWKKFAETHEAGATIVEDAQYLGISQSKYGKIYEFRGKDEVHKTVLNYAGHLAYLLENSGNCEVGDFVKIAYAGKTKLETGPYAGTDSHNFELYVAKKEDEEVKEEESQEVIDFDEFGL